MKKIAACLTISSALFADAELFEKENDAIRCCEYTPAFHPGDPLCPECNSSKILPAYAGVALDECAWDVYGVGEFLYWQPHFQNTVIAIQNINNAPTNNRNEIVDNYGYRPAFRVGVGMVMENFANWILNVDYTWFHHGFSKNVSATLPQTLSTGLGGATAAGTYSFINTRTHFNWDIVAANVQTNFYIGRHVTINPYFGLKWLNRKATISQSLTRTTVGNDFQTATTKRDGIGPDVGANINWILDWGFSMVGKIDLAVLYDYVAEIHQSATIFGAPNSVTTFRGHTNTMATLTKGGLGMAWGSYFWCNQMHFNLAATYDILLDVTALFNTADDQMMQSQFWWLEGLTLTAQFDF